MGVLDLQVKNLSCVGAQDLRFDLLYAIPKSEQFLPCRDIRCSNPTLSNNPKRMIFGCFDWRTADYKLNSSIDRAPLRRSHAFEARFACFHVPGPHEFSFTNLVDSFLT